MPRDLHSTEALREALLIQQRAHRALQATSSETQHLLEALESLLAQEDRSAHFEQVFRSLRKAFSFSQALMLTPGGPADRDELLHCLAAEPPQLTGSTWPMTPMLHKVLAGRVVATVPTRDPGAGPDALPLLYLPVRVRDRRGILMLIGEPGQPGFDRGHVELGRRFSLLVSLALAARFANETELEGQRLLALSERLAASEQAAQRSADLLKQIVGSLPVGLAVQDEDGRLLLINEMAAEVIKGQVGELLDTDPLGLLGLLGLQAQQPPRQLGRRKADATPALLASECELSLPENGRTLLLSSKPVQVLAQHMLLTTLSDISDRKRYEQALALRAFYDELTGLPNRALIEEKVTAALHSCPPGALVALAFIDLDNFKQINDFYSHAVGDALLQAVAQRVTACIRPGDTVARISGDEFLLLITPLQGVDDLPPIIERVVEALKQPFELEGHQLLTSASLGASLYPLHGDSYEQLRRSADNAMYRAKLERKGSAQYFNPAMGTALTARMDLEQRLRAAIRERRFRTALQAKVDLHSGALIGYEALIRWLEPDGSMRLPGSFIELATELGLLDQLSRFVIEEVAEQLPALRRRFGAHITVSLNIGARQASDVDFMRELIETLPGGLASSIILELTEDALVEAERFRLRVLPMLRAAGLRVSIDDFGTGYSSLAMLSDVIADEIKVDRAFITDVHQRPRSQGILRGIESLCRALNISTVAEGVETAEELAYLRQHSSIRCAQGFYFARPLLIAELLAGPEASGD